MRADPSVTVRPTGGVQLATSRLHAGAAVPASPRSPRFERGACIGKFNPPHLGHAHLIASAAASCDELHVLVCDRADQTIRGSDRAAWLADIAPRHVRFHVTADDLPDAPGPWAERTLDLLGPVDAVFTSEAYGPAWAQEMGAQHVAVDPQRGAFPTSGSALRRDLSGNFTWLVPAARAALARRVVLVGAESTGKSTLARDLADHLGEVWVPEHGRTYCDGHLHLRDQAWTSAEFRHIARVQTEMIDTLARRSQTGLVLADTDALVTAVWHQRYRGHDDPELEALATARVPALYLLCAPDLPWVQDGTRESRAHRLAMHDELVRRTLRSGAEVVEIAGHGRARLDAALTAIAEIPACAPLR
jgi:HTH-type transcriptional regulator, transcriptional repressor of NAD biosynthesis genes